MANYKIFHCPHCKILLYCSSQQENKKCPKCQKNLKVKSLKILRTTDSIQEAIILIQNLKIPSELRQEIINYPKKSLKLQSKTDSFFDFVHKIQKNTLNQIIDENFFLKEAEYAGFSKEWVLKQLIELKRQGFLISPLKGYIQFIL